MTNKYSELEHETSEKARDLCRSLRAKVGTDGTADLRTIVDSALQADPNVTLDELVTEVLEARIARSIEVKTQREKP